MGQALRHACPQAYPGGARCVQRFDDSLDSAIHITYRISLRSSSLWEPRHPPVRVVWHFAMVKTSPERLVLRRQHSLVRPLIISKSAWEMTGDDSQSEDQKSKAVDGSKFDPERFAWVCVKDGYYGNDPSAGSPTETLLRLHLPLNSEV